MAFLLFFLILFPISLEASPSECVREERHLAILALAEESVSKARRLHPDCVEEDNSRNCCESERIAANLDIALNLMTKVKNNYPSCGGENDISNEKYSPPHPSEYTLNDEEFEDLMEIISTRTKDDLTTCDPQTVIVNNTQTLRLHKKPADCSEVLENGNSKSGLHRVWLRNRILKGKGHLAFCDMDTDGGGWTVIQRRGQFGNSEDYFERTWEEYKHGFGSLTEEFWLGNDKIFALTNQGQYSVRFDLVDGNGTSAFAEFKTFWIENEENKYKLHISKYSGNAGDSLSTHSGAHFYTVDHPNQPKESIPEWKRSGGWWLNHIMTTSLNGRNLLGTDKLQSRDGIAWHTFGGFLNSLAFTEIKVRPKKFKI